MAQYDKSLAELMVKCATKEPNIGEYSLNEGNKAVAEKLRLLAPDYYGFLENKVLIFRYITEAIDQAFPARVTAAFDPIAETKVLAFNEKQEFEMKKGFTRGRSFVTRAALGGQYQAFKLDKERFSIDTHTYGVASKIELNELLTGSTTMADLVDIAMMGFEDRILEQIQLALFAAIRQTRPTNTVVNTSAFSGSSLEDLIMTIEPYGTPVIYAPKAWAMKVSPSFITNGAAVVEVLDSRDVAEKRDRGYLSGFEGTPMIIMPNSWADENNTTLRVNPRVAYVLPMSDKVVKIAVEGPTLVQEFDNRDRSMQMEISKTFGVGVVGNLNSWGVYQNTGITFGGWSSVDVVNTAYTSFPV